jgi:hypothetical protein
MAKGGKLPLEQEEPGAGRSKSNRPPGSGGYALGTGNSVPCYMPMEKYFAMLKAAEL